MRCTLLLLAWMALAPPSSAQAFDLDLQAHAGGGVFAGRGWGANRPAEALAASLSLRLHALVSLDARFVAQRLRYRSIAHVDSDGRSLFALAGAHVYPLAQRYRVEPRIGLFAGQIGTRARSQIDDGPSVALQARFFAVGPAVGAHVRFGRYAAGFDAQVLRTFEQSACMRGAARSVSCDALGHTRSYLATVLLTFSVRIP